MLEECYVKAKETIKKCSTKHGLFASAGKKAYRGVWSRDSMISLIGASVCDEEIFKEQFKKSLTILKNKQSKKGQIPNAVYGFDSKKIKVDYLSIDSSLWFIIGHFI
jgi:glycogen debranching enzyme